jgi:2-amino-4-hydroxy-6-hydroxymethyldihydropteridine diphosphokinase
MNVAYLLIGGNLGDRSGYLNEAISKIASLCGSIKQLSAVYESEAWGDLNQPNYLNQAIELHTELNAHDLLKSTQLIEQALGRVRDKEFGSRTLDIDILYFNDSIIQDTLLTIPHPRISERQFVLIPMNEIAKMLYDPVLKMTIHEILSVCKDKLSVDLYK